MKFLVDESSGGKLSRFLLEKGYDVKFVTECMPRASDENVLKFAEKEKRILITNDKDFGESIFRLGRSSSGVILLRLGADSPENRQKYVSAVIEKFPDKLESRFAVVSESGIRIRKLP